MNRVAMPATVVLSLVAALLSPGIALAAVPPNDTFKSPTPIASVPSTTAFDLTGATDDTDTPPCEAGSHRRIWYSYTPAVDQVVRVSVGSEPSAELALWTVTKPTTKAPKLTGCAVGGSDLIVKLTAGTKYDISVGQWTLDPPFAGTLSIALQEPPPNDSFADAISITSSPFEASIGAGEFTASTLETGEPIPTCAAGFDNFPGSAWYRFAPVADSQVVIPSFDSNGQLGIYDGTQLTGLSQVGCINGSGNGRFSAQAGHTYYLQVYGATAGNTVLSLTFDVPPPNDAFADRISLQDLPAPVTADLTIATTESGEPLPSCAPGGRATAWWTFTPPADGILQLTDDNPGLFIAAYEGSTLSTLDEIGCTTWYNTLTLPVTAGHAVAIQAGAVFFEPTTMGFTASFAESPVNDDIANAVALDAIPASAPADLTAATNEPGESSPSCAFNSARSVWYRFTAPADSVSISLEPGSYGFGVSAYSGTPGALAEIGCRNFDGFPVTVRSTAGSPVYVAVWAYDYVGNFSTTVHLDPAPDAVADFGMWPPDPTSSEDVAFFDQSTDPGGSAVATRTWDFGDGSASTHPNPVHRYAADGDYTVTYSITTTDGRSASTSKAVAIRTHDVGIVRFMVPSTAKSGQTKTITVGVGNRHYPENVTVQLFAARGSVEELVGSTTVDIPVLGANQGTDVPFVYTFTKADATAGKVTFRALVYLNNGRDAAPTDNQAIALATKVSR
jgi:hypothetical protein